jgi:hypothetical protein
MGIKPSRTQRTVLTRLAAGDQLIYDGRRGWGFLRSEGGVRWATILSMLGSQWLERRQAPQWMAGACRITEAGRKVIAYDTNYLS